MEFSSAHRSSNDCQVRVFPSMSNCPVLTVKPQGIARSLNYPHHGPVSINDPFYKLVSHSLAPNLPLISRKLSNWLSSIFISKQWVPVRRYICGCLVAESAKMRNVKKRWLSSSRTYSVPLKRVVMLGCRIVVACWSYSFQLLRAHFRKRNAFSSCTVRWFQSSKSSFFLRWNVVPLDEISNLILIEIRFESPARTSRFLPFVASFMCVRAVYRGFYVWDS